MIIDRLPRFLREDWLRKSMALAFAVLLWFYVNEQLRDEETFHDVPVTISYDKGMLYLEKNTVAVNIRVRGSFQQLQKLRGSDLKVTATILADEVPAGKLAYDLRLTSANVEAPIGIRVESIDPPLQQIQVDRMETKSGVPVRVRYAGSLADGYQISRCTIVPSQVEVRAPSQILQDIQELVTDPVPLDATLTTGFEMEKKLVPISRVVPGTSIVHVQVEISKQSIQQAYESLIITVLTDPLLPWEVIEPLSPVTVVLRGPQPVLDSMDKSAIRPFIDLSKVTTPGYYRRPVQVWTSGAVGVVVESVTPSIVDVTVVDQSGDFSLPPPLVSGTAPAKSQESSTSGTTAVTNVEIIPMPVAVPEEKINQTPLPKLDSGNREVTPMPLSIRDDMGVPDPHPKLER